MIKRVIEWLRANLNFRIGLYWLIRNYIIKVPEYEYIPKKWRWIEWIIFPMHSYFNNVYGKRWVRIDPMNDFVWIAGQMYSMVMFRGLSENIGSHMFRFVIYNRNGAVEVRRELIEE